MLLWLLWLSGLVFEYSLVDGARPPWRLGIGLREGFPPLSRWHLRQTSASRGPKTECRGEFRPGRQSRAWPGTRGPGYTPAIGSLAPGLWGLSSRTPRPAREPLPGVSGSRPPGRRHLRILGRFDIALPTECTSPMRVSECRGTCTWPPSCWVAPSMTPAVPMIAVRTKLHASGYRSRRSSSRSLVPLEQAHLVQEVGQAFQVGLGHRRGLSNVTTLNQDFVSRRTP